MWAFLSSWMEERNASIVAFACWGAGWRYLVVCPALVSLMLGSGRVSEDWTRRVVLRHEFLVSSVVRLDSGWIDGELYDVVDRSWVLENDDIRL